MFRNLIFDWSGTLCNDLPPVLDTVNAILEHYGLDTMDQTEFLEEFRLPFAGFYEKRLPGATADELEALYREFFPRSTKKAEPIPHAREFVEWAADRDHQMFVLSAVTHSHYEEQARSLGFDGVFKRTYLGVRDKLEWIHQILDENGLETNQTCFIGDMRHDIDAAKHAGITSIAVLTGYDSAEKLALSEPDWVVEDLSGLRLRFEKSE